MRYPSKLHIGALRLMREMEFTERGRAADERAEYRRSFDDLPANVRRVEFRCQLEDGTNVYNVYTDSLDSFSTYRAQAGSERDAALKEMAS